jgi:hypothetical protein
VAQPGDDTCFHPRIGPYDIYNIKWGYRPILDADTPEEELPTLRGWILEKGDDPTYRFGDGSSTDPTSLSEALGDDAMRASDLGVENLKRTLVNLREWAGEPGEDYSQIAELYGAILGQWNRYVGHVVTNIGGVVWTRRSQSQDGPPYIPVPQAIQRRAMDYLNRQVFQTPEWMLDRDLLYRIQDSGTPDRIQQLQAGALNRVLDVDRMKRLIERGLPGGDGLRPRGDAGRPALLRLDRAGNGPVHRRLPEEPAEGLSGPGGHAHGGPGGPRYRHRPLPPG